MKTSFSTKYGTRVGYSAKHQHDWNPPDVSGWDLGESWINSATMIARMKWGE